VLLPLYAIFKESIAKNYLERAIGRVHDELTLEVHEEQAEEHA
jgi:DNA polymerase I-like protein with 3'-5' exonuclease and polymerase domains